MTTFLIVFGGGLSWLASIYIAWRRGYDAGSADTYEAVADQFRAVTNGKKKQ